MLKMLTALLGLAVLPAVVVAQNAQLLGTWRLVAADVVRPDGTTAADYGPSPRGVAIFTVDSQYVVEIYRSVRTKFASNDRSRSTPDEYRDAALSISTHFGKYTVDQVNGTIIFAITSASFPNLDGTTQVRPYTLTGDTLSWRVAPRPDGSIPISRFVRVH